MIEVLRPGLQTTVQDLGRPGLRSQGVPAGGVMDPWAARAANRLVGNPDGAALLEVLLAGPTLRFAVPAAIALVGGDFSLSESGNRLAPGVAHWLRAGSVLEIGRGQGGARAWLAVGGGFEVPVVLGSRSTDLAGGFGGHVGRALVDGDRLFLGPAPEFVARRLTKAFEESLAGSLLRIVPGPDLDAASGARAALTADLKVSPRADRRGLRLECLQAGCSRALASPRGEMRSQGVLPGAIEWTPSCELIVLSVDGPVTGGYPWVAQLIEADIGRLAHLVPGAPVRFAETDFAQAEESWSQRERDLTQGVVR